MITNKSNILALKYRPRLFQDLIGQEVIVETILNAIKLNKVAKRIGSKSIFTGPIDNQIITKEIKDAPEASDVIDFILKSI